MKLIDPRKFDPTDLPYIVFVDDRQSMLGWAIKWHSKGNYGHVMNQCSATEFASQGFSGYKKVPIERYLKKRYFLKFYRCKDLSRKRRRKWTQIIESNISKSKKKSFWNKYDFWSYIGHLLRIRAIQNPWAENCAEIESEGPRRAIPMNISKHLNPSEFNEFLEKSDLFECVGYWFKDSSKQDPQSSPPTL